MLYQISLLNIYRIFCSSTKECTFHPSTQVNFSKTDYTLGYKTNLNKYKKTERIPCILLDHNYLSIKSTAKVYVITTQTNGELNKVLLKDKWVRVEIGKEKYSWN